MGAAGRGGGTAQAAGTEMDEVDVNNPSRQLCPRESRFLRTAGESAARAPGKVLLATQVTVLRTHKLSCSTRPHNVWISTAELKLFTVLEFLPQHSGARAEISSDPAPRWPGAQGRGSTSRVWSSVSWGSTKPGCHVRSRAARPNVPGVTSFPAASSFGTGF